MDLEFGKCKLQVQVPQRGDYTKPEDLIGKNVVTSFTHLTEQYFRKMEAQQAGNATNGETNNEAKLKTQIKFVGGSVEAACALGVADGIVDLVESGETMRAAGLKAISTVLDTTAVLIRSKHPSDPKLVDLITARIRGVISAYHSLFFLIRIADSTQPPKNMCSAHITLSALGSMPLVKSRLVNTHLQSTV